MSSPPPTPPAGLAAAVPIVPELLEAPVCTTQAVIARE